MMNRAHLGELSANKSIAAFASLPPNDETMAHNVRKKVITKGGDDMERPLKQYPIRTSAELNALLRAAESCKETRNEKIPSHRTNVVFPAFQKELLAAGTFGDVGVNQWKRLRYADKWLSYLLEPLPEIVLSFTKPVFDAKNPTVEAETWVSKIANLTDGCIIRFNDGEIAHVWLPDALDEFYRGVDDHQPLEPLCIQWDKEYDELYPADENRNMDKRHLKDEYRTGQKKFYEDQGIHCGTAHYRIMPIRGHSNDPTWDHSGPWCQSVTERSNGGRKGNSKAAERVAALKIFEARLVPVEDALSALYKAVAPKQFPPPHRMG
ncbi:hypothetical protein IFR05_010420 [Cadophora sp. M221]|nr:hypothetical protein IFR05_010420 [Cadophora sp. M221]